MSVESVSSHLTPLLIAGAIASLLVIALLHALLVSVLARRRSSHKNDPAVLEGVRDGFLILDQKRRVTGYNSRLSSMLPEKESNPATGGDVRNLYEQLCQDSTQALQKLDDWLGSLSGDSTSNLELTTSNDKHLLISEKNIQQGRVASTIRDISEQRHSLKQLDEARELDALTGLPNRMSLMNHLRQAVRDQSAECTLLVCDLRDFRQINDSYGQHFADQLLIEVAQRLQKAMPANSIVARIAGDEFGVLVPRTPAGTNLQDQAKQFLEEIAKGIPVAARVLPVRASMGLAFAPTDGTTAGELISAVDSAVATAKASGSNTLATYDRRRQQAADRAHQIDIGLEKALERNELAVHYQPQVDVRTNLTSGMEALLRWHSRSLGLISPGIFIPRAERSDIINRIGEWVLRQAIADYQCLARIGTSPATLSINLSRRQFARREDIDALAAIISSCGLAPELLTLEITETALLHNREQAREMLIALKDLGVKLSIDDFGVGYSSFAELRDFPIDEVKIDRTFIRNIETCKKNQHIIRATVDVAESMDAEVVAEGIETSSQFDTVRELGCHRAQGFFLCEPMQATMIPDACLGNQNQDDMFEATLVISD